MCFPSGARGVDINSHFRVNITLYVSFSFPYAT